MITDTTLQLPGGVCDGLHWTEETAEGKGAAGAQLRTYLDAL